jgi:Ser/Thr protein kinase RdoA (MazF antagonist)
MTEHQEAGAIVGEQGQGVFPAQSSVLDESALLKYVVSAYEIGPAESCRFLERGDADIYRVKAGGAHYYLKVFRPPRSEAHAESEARFVARLAEAGLPVVRAILRTDGGHASVVLASEGMRPILLFEEAPPPLDRKLSKSHMEAVGQAIARVHDLADADAPSYELRTFDLKTLEAERAPHIRRFASEEDTEFMAAVIEWIRPQLSEIPREPPEWGICHADLVMSNLRMGDRGLTLFDFGGAARTFRGYELAVVYWSLGHRYRDQREELWGALLRGYASVRPLPARLKERLAAFRALRELAFLGGNAATLPLRLGTEPFESSFMSDGFNRIRFILKEAGVPDIS